MIETIQQNKLLSVDETIELIENGQVLVVSGEESLLKQLPQGKWIGGTIPYFYLENEHGRMDKEHLFVSNFSDLVDEIQITTYEEEYLENVCANGYENGFNFMILPALRDIHLSFALNAPRYEKLFDNPLIGLIAGVDLEEFSNGRLSKTFNGMNGQEYTDSAVVLHAQLPSHKVARLEIINVFEPSNDLTIEVEFDGFVFDECIINGKKQNLYEYIKENDIDISYPLVCDYSGATVNISFQRLDDEKKQVVFYAPLFKGEKYTNAKKFNSYVETFKAKSSGFLEREANIIYNCNCILNYLYGGLDKNSIGFSGATTFGEIAYQMLNQTFTYLAIDEH